MYLFYFIYLFFLQIKYVLIQYFIWTIKMTIYENIYLFAKKYLLTIFTKKYIFIVSYKNILGKISIVGYDEACNRYFHCLDEISGGSILGQLAA